MNCKDYHGYVVWDDGTVIGKQSKKPLKNTITKWGYETAHLCINRKIENIGVHRLLAKLFLPNIYGKTTVDHKDRNRTNNSLYNLRWATREEQCQNTGMSSRNTSGVKGVNYNKRERKWYATMIVNGRRHDKGFKTKEEAITQRLEWEKIYYQK